MHQRIEMPALFELCELVRVTETASLGQILIIQSACRIGDSQDGLVGSLHVSGGRITAVAEVAGQTGCPMGRCEVVLVIRIEFFILYVEIGITVAVNTAVGGSGAGKKSACDNHGVEHTSSNTMLHLRLPDLMHLHSGWLISVTASGEVPNQALQAQAG